MADPHLTPEWAAFIGAVVRLTEAAMACDAALAAYVQAKEASS